MASASKYRLDRFICKNAQLSRHQVRSMLAQGRIKVDGDVIKDAQYQINRFHHVELDDRCLQKEAPQYIMLHKPADVLSATKDRDRTTALDLIDLPCNQDLHIAGRLDIGSTGMLLLTNDSDWSKRLSDPEKGVVKKYQVKLNRAICSSDVEVLSKGIYFKFENRFTLPAVVKPYGDNFAEVHLTEGRYRQIRRMFGQLGYEVLSLHRFAIGDLQLGDLAERQWRHLSAEECQVQAMK